MLPFPSESSFRASSLQRAAIKLLLLEAQIIMRPGYHEQLLSLAVVASVCRGRRRVREPLRLLFPVLQARVSLAAASVPAVTAAAVAAVEPRPAGVLPLFRAHAQHAGPTLQVQGFGVAVAVQHVQGGVGAKVASRRSRREPAA